MRLTSATKWRRVIVSMSAVALTLGALVPAAAASAAQPPGTRHTATHRYQDYLNSAGTSANLAAGQCSAPVAQRKGGWVCPIANSAKRPLAQTSGKWCDAAGCYWWVNYAQTEFVSDAGTFGYGGQVLGEQDGSFVWSLNGTLVTCKPFVYGNSADTNTVTLTGQLLNPPPKTDGQVINGTYEQYSFPGEVVSASWPSPGYQASDNQNYYHSAVQEEAWSVDGYPGYWYFWVKSPISKSSWSDSPYGGYQFMGIDASVLPTNSHGAGWHA